MKIISVLEELKESLSKQMEQNGEPINLEDYPGDDCHRECIPNSPRVCYFKWHLEHYHTNGP